MWEEDPRWQEANYRFLLFLVAVLTVGVAVWSAWERKWAVLGYWMLGLTAVFFALCLHAAVVWMIGHLIVWLGRLLKRLFVTAQALILLGHF
jgi:hypothetical protein